MLEETFGNRKPVIAMAHFPPLPGAPHYDADAGMDGILDYVSSDLKNLQDGGVDCLMFGNEGDRPYLLSASPESLAAMAAAIIARSFRGQLPVGSRGDGRAWRCHRSGLCP
jgi:predicted TIM-barrel enzyme